MRDDRFQGNGVCMVSQLRTALLLHSIKDRSDLISPEVRKLAFYDRKKMHSTVRHCTGILRMGVR